MSKINVLSLYAPWAVAIAIGHKKIETRSWKTEYRGELYIHTTKKTPKNILNEERNNYDLIYSMLQHNIHKPLSYHDCVGKEWDVLELISYNFEHNGLLPDNLLGVVENTLEHCQIIAKCNLVDCVRVVNYSYGLDDNSVEYTRDAILGNGTRIPKKEYNLGEYTIGRYAWMLEDVEILQEPISAKGKQRIWTMEV